MGGRGKSRPLRETGVQVSLWLRWLMAVGLLTLFAACVWFHGIEAQQPVAPAAVEKEPFPVPPALRDLALMQQTKSQRRRQRPAAFNAIRIATIPIGTASSTRRKASSWVAWIATAAIPQASDKEHGPRSAALSRGLAHVGQSRALLYLAQSRVARNSSGSSIPAICASRTSVAANCHRQRSPARTNEHDDARLHALGRGPLQQRLRPLQEARFGEATA